MVQQPNMYTKGDSSYEHRCRSFFLFCVCVAQRAYERDIQRQREGDESMEYNIKMVTKLR